MSIKIMSQVWDDPAIKSPVEVAVMLVLADYANDEGTCWPSFPTIIRKSRCCRGTVWRVINDMISRKKLSKKQGGGASIPNRYTLHLETVQPVNGSSGELFDNGSGDELITVQGMNNNGSGDEPDPSGSTIRSIRCAKESKLKAFKPPTLEEMKLLAAKAGLPESEAQAFIDYYDSNGWKVGRNPMRNHEAAFRNWTKNYHANRYTNRGNSRQGFDRNKGTANEGNADRYAKVPTANQ